MNTDWRLYGSRTSTMRKMQMESHNADIITRNVTEFVLINTTNMLHNIDMNILIYSNIQHNVTVERLI